MRIRAGRVITGALIVAAVAVYVGEFVTEDQRPMALLARWEHTRHVAGEAQTRAWLAGFWRGEMAFCLLTGREEFRNGPDPYNHVSPGAGRLEFLTDFPLSWQTMSALTGPTPQTTFGITMSDKSDGKMGPARLRMRTVTVHPALPPILLIAWPVLYAVWSVRRTMVQQRRLDRGLCVGCGYDLSGTPDRCPECGRAATVRPT